MIPFIDFRLQIVKFGTLDVRKWRVFAKPVTYVTGPVKINHVISNYTKLHFCNIFSSECDILFLLISEESPLNSAVVIEILFW